MISFYLNLFWFLLVIVIIFVVLFDYILMKKKFFRSVWIWFILSVIYDKIIEKFLKDYNICLFLIVRNGRYFEFIFIICDKLVYIVGKD